MEILDKIQHVYRSSKSYPELVKQLIELGIQSYTVDVATSTILYRLLEGKIALHPGDGNPRAIATQFDQQLTIQAVRDTQQGKTDYPAFMNAIAASGVRFYEATLNGPHKRVTYIGTGGKYEESIPV